MKTAEYPTITLGRTLLDCSPMQFEQYNDPQQVLPRKGYLKEVMDVLGFEVSEIDGRWYVHDKDGNGYAEAERNARQAMIAWWRKVGLDLTRKHRDEQQLWKNRPGPGRKPSVEDPTGARAEELRAAREENHRKLHGLWQACREVLIGHSPQAEVWLDVGSSQSVPRRHCRHKIGESRAVAEALRSLLDLDGMNKDVSEALASGVAPETLGETMMSEFPNLGVYGEVAGLATRMALQVALQLSEDHPDKLFGDLRKVLEAHQLSDADDLRALIKNYCPN